MCPVCGSSVKSLQKFIKEGSSSAVLLGGRYYPREASFRTSFDICPHRTSVGVEPGIVISTTGSGKSID